MKATNPIWNHHLKKLGMLATILLASAVAFALFAPSAIPGGRDQAFAATKSYKVIYHLNGGKNAKTNPKTIAAGKTVTLKSPTRTGYTFKGWYTTKTCKTKITKVKGVADASKRTVWAKWAAKSYKISYKLNGGTQAAGQRTSYTIASATYKLKAPSRKGYSFVGWYKDAGFKNKVTQIKKGSIGNLTLYAKWKPVTYTISYNLAGGTQAAGQPKSYTIESATFSLKEPTRSGYSFAGWTGTGLSKATKAVKIAKGSTGNRSYKATWTETTAPEEPTTYNVRFFWEYNGVNYNWQDSTMADKKPIGSSFSITIGETEYYPCRGYEFKEPLSTSNGIAAESFPALSKTGLLLDGWYLRKYGQEWNDATLVTSVAAGEIPAGTTTSGLFPHWVRPTLAPSLDGGTWVDAAAPFTSSGTLAGMPSKDGQWFSGWYTAAEGGEAVATAADVIAKVTPNESGKYPIFARWTPVDASAGQAVLLGGGMSSDGFNRTLRNATGSGGLGASSARSIVVSHDATTQGKIVSASDSPVPVYATYDSGTRQITLHVASNERVKLNANSSNLCESLEYLRTFDFDQFDTGDVEKFSQSFYNCINLTSINGLGNIDISSVHYVNKMFQGCNNLEDATLRQIEQWPAETVNANFWAVDCMFNSCYQLERMDLSSWTLAAMNNSGQGDGNGNDETNNWLDSMFGRCSKLEYLNLQGIDMRDWKATSIYVDNMSHHIGAQDIVENCTSLKTLVLGEGFKQDDYGDEEQYRHIAKFPVAMKNGSQTCAAGDAIPDGAGTWIAANTSDASSLQSANVSW